MLDDEGANISDYIGRMFPRIQDEGANISDVIRSANGDVTILAPTALARAQAIEVTVSASMDTVVVGGAQPRTIQFGLNRDRAAWVEFVAALGMIYEILTRNGVSASQAMLVVGIVAGLCIAHLSDGS